MNIIPICLRSVLFALLLASSSLFAQTVFVPGGGSGIGATPSGNSNVGIGVATPVAPLDVGANGQVWIRAGSGGGLPSSAGKGLKLEYGSHGGIIQAYDYAEDAHKNLLLNTVGGNVGIGTAAPHAKLQVMGDVRSYKDGADSISSHMYIGNAANSRAWNWQLTANGNSALWGYDGSWWNEIVRFTATGNVGIGTANPTHKLAVKGTIRAYEVIVDTGWSDYVFADDYRLAPLAEVEAHIGEHRHLPGIPSAARVAAEGVSLGEMQSRLLAKVEELTLHLIRMEKKNASLRERVQSLESAVRQELGR